MLEPSDATDLRRADDDALLRALGEGQPLALAEAYHRSVPAAHAIARRLLGGVNDVESLLLTVYTQLWEAPPTDGPLEGWIRRTTWARGAERLRATQAAPASPSAAGLLPDLPAPDVRFLDAAERAIAELPDDARRALLLSHDKGVASEAQDPGAGHALTAALVALAGPETSTGDRDAVQADACDDVETMGDWCLGLLGVAGESTVSAAIDERSGCAATSRAVRRGRRRIEGLPATPDMGQRILVTVLTSGARPLATAPPPPAAAVVADPLGTPDPTLGQEGDAAIPPDAEAPDAVAQDPMADEAPPVEDPFAPPTAPAPAAMWDEGADEDDLFADHEGAGTIGSPEDVDGLQADTPVAGTISPVADTADLPQADVTDTSPSGSWIPGPGDNTAELRLSDILADDEDDDDPFAGLDDPEPVAPPAAPAAAPDSPPAGRRDPYSALRGLGEDDEPLSPQGPVSPDFANPDPTAPLVSLPEDEALVGDYVEGQEEDVDYAGDPASRRMAGILAWVLPILGGGALGIMLAILLIGPPS